MQIFIVNLSKISSSFFANIFVNHGIFYSSNVKMCSYLIKIIFANYICFKNMQVMQKYVWGFCWPGANIQLVHGLRSDSSSYSLIQFVIIIVY